MGDNNQTYKFFIVDDHPMILNATANSVQQKYPGAGIVKVRTLEECIKHFEQISIDDLPDLVIADLSIPRDADSKAESDAGIELLRFLMDRYPFLNLVVQTSFPQHLVKVKPEIDKHQGGFTLVDKSLSNHEMLTRIDWSLHGLTYTKDLRRLSKVVDLQEEWLTVLELAVNEALQDEEIAIRMNLSKETIRNYWNKLQDVLEIYLTPKERKEKGINLRMLIAKRARESGLIE